MEGYFFGTRQNPPTCAVPEVLAEIPEELTPGKILGLGGRATTRTLPKSAIGVNTRECVNYKTVLPETCPIGYSGSVGR